MADTRMQVILQMKQDVDKQLAKVNKSTRDLEGTFRRAGGAFLAFFSAGAVVNFGREVIDASNQMNNALLGLSSIAQSFNQDVDATTEAAKRLASDGLMSISSSAEGLKNLLATGFSLDEATNLMNAFKDSAAFGRQGTLEFGQAIVGATQGIKNQNSIMVDNAGITKNLSNILVEAGFSQQDLSKATTDASVRLALYNGILQEASIFQGDAAKLTETLSGAQSRLTTATFNLKAAIGDALAPTMMVLIQDTTRQVDLMTQYITQTDGAAASTAGLTGEQARNSQSGSTFAQIVFRATNFVVALGKSLGFVIQFLVNFAAAMIDAGKVAISFAKDVSNAMTNLISGVAGFMAGNLDAAKDSFAALSGELLTQSKSSFRSMSINAKASSAVLSQSFDSIGESMLRAVDLKDFNASIKNTSDKTKSAMESAGSAAEKSKKEVEKLLKEVEKANKEYGDLAKEGEKALVELSLDHEENIGRMSDKMKDLRRDYKDATEDMGNKLSRLKESHLDSLGGINEQITSTRNKMLQLRDTLQEEEAGNVKTLAQAFVQAQDSVTSLQNKLKGEISFGDRQKVEEELEKQQAALARFAGLQMKFSDDISAVREFNNLTDIERAVLAFDENMRIARQEFEHKTELLNQEVQKLNEKRQIEIKQHKAKIAEIKKETQQKLDNIAQEIGKVTAQKVIEEALFKKKTEVINSMLESAEKHRQETQAKTFKVTKETVEKEIELYKRLASAIRETSRARSGSLIPRGIPALAEGGIVSRPTIAMIGEAGAEAVVPLDRLPDVGGGGSNIVVNLNGGNYLSEDAAVELGDHIVRRLQLAVNVT